MVNVFEQVCQWFKQKFWIYSKQISMDKSLQSHVSQIKLVIAYRFQGAEHEYDNKNAN